MHGSPSLYLLQGFTAFSIGSFSLPKLAKALAQ
jgi:hypothetical protein